MTACTSLSTLTALYSPLDIEYAQEMSGPYEDMSFHSDECTVIAAVKDEKMTGFWRPMVAVGDDKLLKSHIERLYDVCKDIKYMDFCIDGELSVISQFLLRQGYKATPYSTQVIDLTKSEPELKADLRKSYKSIVNKNPIISLIGDIEPYRKLHAKMRGETRPPYSWFMQQKMLWNKSAFCILQSKAINPIVVLTQVGGLFYYNEHCCYYASGCSLEGENSHKVIWEAILHAKGLGCKEFEMGEQVFSGDKKLVNISKFKRGFGGETKTRMILERKKNEEEGSDINSESCKG